MASQADREYRDFVASNLDRLCRFAYLICHDWQRAEDAVQKSLTKLYLHWNRIRSSSPHAYVRRIIVNTLNEERRRFWFKREHSSDELPDVVQPDHAESSTSRMAMLESLARLPKRQRLAVVLRFWEDLSVEQTAEVMNCSTGTVKSQTARGLQTLRGLLGESIPTQVEGAQS